MKKLFSIILFSASILFAGIGDNAADFTLEKFDGGSVSLNDYDGKIIYIFWFGYGCPYCEDYMPLSQLNVVNNYSSDVFQALGIDTWAMSSVSNVASFQASTVTANLPTGVTYPLLIKGGDVAKEYGVTYDRSMIIDQQGVIRYYDGSHLGGHDWDEINSVIEGLLTTTDIHDNSVSPYKFELKPNYPNPFNPQTSIPFTVNETQKVKLEIYNVTGQLVKTIINAEFAAGSYTAAWNAIDNNNNAVSSGVYFSRLTGERVSQTRQIILIK